MLTGQFFFLRPWWLVLTVMLLALYIYLLRRRHHNQDSAWNGIIDAHLLKHLTVTQNTAAKPKGLMLALFFSLFVTVIAMAGPTWEKNKLPAFESNDPVVIALSLAQSMNSQDISPNRLTRASHKISDILNTSKGNDVGFVVYADRPFTASPLTTDSRLIKEMLPELTPDLMPVLNNRLDLAINHAADLIKQAGTNSGQIIIMTNDGGDQLSKSIAAAKAASDDGFNVNIIGIGTPVGAELITASGQTILDKNNQPVVSILESDELTQITQAGAGKFVELSADSTDIDSILDSQLLSTSKLTKFSDELSYDDWKDMGFWLLFVPVLLAPLAFRRGLLMSLPACFILTSLVQTPTAEAFDWNDLWKTKNQQAAQAYGNQQFSQAAQSFQDPLWKASALYKAGKYKDAVAHYENHKGVDRDFNLANSLAKSGEFEKSIDAYNRVLEKHPDDEDALFNRNLISKVLEQQQQSNEQAADSKKDKSSQQNSDQGQDDSNQENHQSNTDKNENNNSEGRQNQQTEPNQKSNEEQDAQSQQANSEQENNRSTTKQNEQSSQGQADEPQQHNSSQGEKAEKKQSVADDQQVESAKTSLKQAEENSPESPAQKMIENQQNSQELTESSIKDTAEALNKIMDKILKASNDEPTTEPAKSEVGQTESHTSLNQSAEQLLRTVPDNSSGLLKARIKQHYGRLRQVN